MSSTSYRPHNPGHDYYEPGAYLITLVVTARERRLSALNYNAYAPTPAAQVTPDVHTPAAQVAPGAPTPATQNYGTQPIANTESSRSTTLLTATGRIVHEEWEKTATIQAAKGRKIETLCQVCMPDHWHGVIIVRERMDRSLGYIIQCFKSACTARWRREVTGYVETASTAAQIRCISANKRRAYYATRPLVERPLFDDDYDDTICLNAEHLRRMIDYVADNPRRAIIRHLNPQFMQRVMHITIAGRDYAAFGNLFLLGWVRKEQVFCHRKARLSQLNDEERIAYGFSTNNTRSTNNTSGTNTQRHSTESESTYITHVPYAETQAFRTQGNAHYLSVMRGATVLVTPGISEGEKRIKNMALERRLPLIHLQKEPIGPLWKPEKQRFDACTEGRLLIIAPWDLTSMGEVNGIAADSNYSQFHNLNTLAEEICKA